MSQKPQLRASEMDRFLSCPGSRLVLSKVKRAKSSRGDEGTWIHYLIAKRLIKELGAIPPEGGLPHPNCEPPESLGFSMWIVDWAVRLVKELVPEDWTLMVEVALAYDLGGFVGSGHIDVLAISPAVDDCMGFDWKSGRNPVDPAGANDQVALYLLLIITAWLSIKRASFRICQPLADEEYGFERVSTVTLDDKKLGALRSSINQRVSEAISNPMDLCTGRQCEYCVGVSCPAIQESVKEMKLRLTEQALSGISEHPSDQLLADMVICGEVIKKPLEEAKEALKQRLKDIEFITSSEGRNVSMKETAGDYNIDDPESFYRELSALIPADKIPFCVTPKIVEIRKEIAGAMNVPISGKSPITGTTLFDAKLRPFTTQSKRKTLMFS